MTDCGTTFTLVAEPVELAFTCDGAVVMAFEVEQKLLTFGSIQGSFTGEANTLVSAATGGGVDLPAVPAKIGAALQVRGINVGPSGLLTVTLDGPNEEVVLDVDTGELMAELLPQLQTLVDEAPGSLTYVGFAEPGVATSAAAWRIFRLDESGEPELVKKYASGSTDFDQVWDNRTSLIYS